MQKGESVNILTIGGATQDIFLHYEGTDFMTIAKKNMVASYMLFQSGEKKEIESIVYETGGGATNSAVTFARQGFQASCFCSIGNDQPGTALQKKLQQEGIKTDFIFTHPTLPTGQSFIINSHNGETTIFAYRGANSALTSKLIPIDHIKTCKQLYITSLSHASASILPQITCLAKEHNIPVAINPGISQLAQGTQQLKESLSNIDTLILNSAEAQIFMLALVQKDKSYKDVLECGDQTNPTGINLDNNQAYLLCGPLAYEDRFFSIRQFFKAVLNMGPRIVVVTNGRNGVYVASENHVVFCPSKKVPITNTVGAGDAFGSCFVASLLQGCTIEDAVINGNINSASVLGHVGAKTGLLTTEELAQHRTSFDKTLLQRVCL